MSVTYKCDRCGHQEHYTDGIVGNEFAHYGPRHSNGKLKDRRQFHTVSPQWRVGEIVDVCDGCFKIITAAAAEAKQETAKGVMERFRAIISA